MDISNYIEAFSEIDLGRTVLSGVLILGFFLFFLTIIRAIEIPIRIYLDSRSPGKKTSEKNQVNKAESEGFKK